MIQCGIDVRQLGKRRLFFRYSRKIGTVCFVIFVQPGAGIRCFAVKQNGEMGRGCQPDHFQHGADKAHGSVDGSAVFSCDPGGHTIIHLKEQVGTVDDQQSHSITLR